MIIPSAVVIALVIMTLIGIVPETWHVALNAVSGLLAGLAILMYAMFRSNRQQKELLSEIGGIKTEIATMNNTMIHGFDAVIREIRSLRRDDILPSTDSRGSGRKSPV